MSSICSLIKGLSLCVAVSLVFGQIAKGATTSVTEKPSAAPSVPGQYVVQLKKNQALFGTVALERTLHAKILKSVRPDMIVVERNKNEDRTNVVKELNANPAVIIAEPNYIFHAFRTPNNPEYAKVWGLNNRGAVDTEGTLGVSGVDIGMEKAWDITTGSRNVVVAVVDTGVDFSIPGLKNNAWVNEAELHGKPGVDDDGNGYIDDINGFNFVANNGDVKDDNGHGSHCSGTIGAEGDNGVGLPGINWQVSIMAVKFLDSEGGGSLDNAVKALDYARKNKAQILSNSWGGNAVSAILQKAVQDTHDAGELFMAAAGNDGQDNDHRNTIPAGYSKDMDNVVAVAAVDNRGELAFFSNYGLKNVDIAAPGVNIYSTVPATMDATGFKALSGTSMACPHAAGVAALLLSANPNWKYIDIKQRMIATARPLASLNGKVSSGGMIDAYYALTNQKPPADPNDAAVWADSKPYSVSTPHPYTENMDVKYTVQIPGAKKVSVHFSKFRTELGYDTVQFFNSKGESLGKWSGSQDGRFSPIAEGDTLVLEFKSDRSNNDFGFDVDKVNVVR